MLQLLSPLQAGALHLKNRVLMAPLTRCRAEDCHIPGDLMVEYYAQRASAGLLITEATMAIEGCSAFWREPGIYNAEQIAGWRKVTEAVHTQGGKIVLQLWHGGRACHPDLNDGRIPVAPSALAIAGEMVHTPKGKQHYTVPRALDDEEIPAIVEGFVQAAQNAILAGFDGVEVHGANGYLLDQFLRDGSNQREGKYGGSLENRARLMLDVLAAVCGVWGSDRVGLRLSPLNGYNDMHDSDPIGMMSWLGERLNDFKLAYFEVARGDFQGKQSGDVLTPVRQSYQGVLVGNMGYSAHEANQAVELGLVDAVSFGVPFIANPDLPQRIRQGSAWNKADPRTFYSQGAKGYTDYPFLDSTP